MVFPVTLSRGWISQSTPPFAWTRSFTKRELSTYLPLGTRRVAVSAVLCDV